LNFCKYTYFYHFLRNSGHFYFTLIPCFVKCPIIKPTGGASGGSIKLQTGALYGKGKLQVNGGQG
jgi:hypothetical protein